MREKLEKIKNAAALQLKEAVSKEELESLKIKFLGKKGELTQILRGMGNLTKEERPEIGKIANDVREKIEGIISESLEKINQKERKQKLNDEVIDISMPGKKQTIGHRNPLDITLRKTEDIFLAMGFTVEDGPEIEYDKYNFEMLNIPKNHPARGEQDTFYIDDNIVLRTQTSPVQIRTMLNQNLPIKMISPGKVYRSDAADATHSPIFYQVEGLVIDKGVTFADMKGTLEMYIKKMFGENVKTKFRPHHFPFTEPSAELDISCFACGGKGCTVCKGEGFIEMYGCGMVHPNVLRNCGIDPEVYSGFAFGVGLDRIVMQTLGIDDIRQLYESDMKFLKQF